MELVDFLTLYGIINLGIHISMLLVSLNIYSRDNLETISDTESDPDTESQPGTDSQPDMESDGDPTYTQPSDLTMNLRKRKTI
jgi:hypothetical protein